MDRCIFFYWLFPLVPSHLISSILLYKWHMWLYDVKPLQYINIFNTTLNAGMVNITWGFSYANSKQDQLQGKTS